MKTRLKTNLLSRLKRLFVLLCCSVVAWQAQAQFAAIAAFAPKYSPGIVWYLDGHKEEFAAIETPNYMQKKLTVSHDEKRKNKITLEVADIYAVTLWHKDHPEQTFTLMHVQTKTSILNMHPDQWGFPVAQSAWGMAVRCYPSYSFDRKSGELQGVLITTRDSYGMVSQSPILTFLARPGQEKAELVGSDNTFPPKAKELFKENPDIYSALKARRLGVGDLQFILNEMAGGIPAETTPEHSAVQSDQPRVIEETVQNGTVGDDE